MNVTCRACLKICNIFFNTLQYFENNKLVSDMLMECTTVVQRDDELPINICTDCLDKLKVAYEFKMMVIESSRKLHCFPIKKRKENELQNNQIINDSVIIKEEIEFVEFNYDNTNEFAEVQPSSSENKRKEEDIQNLNVAFQNQQTISSKHMECPLDNEACIPSLISQNDTSHLIDDCIEKVELNEKQKASHIYYEYQLSVTEKELKVRADSSGNFDYVNSVVADIARETEREHQPSDSGESTSPDFGSESVGLTEKEKSQKSVFCKDCKRSFGFRYYFEVHVRHHTGNMPFKCETCGKAFAKQYLLNKHKDIHSDVKPFTCDQCGRSFRLLYKLINHKISHSDKRPHKCSICGKSFKQIHALKVHILRHKGERKFTCEICGKCFVEKSGLSGHMVCHRSEKKFPCPDCGKSFASTTSMKNHFKQHVNEKPHACSYCNKCFKHSGVLNRHILIHTGAKPYLCKLCGKSFTQSASLSTHMRIHTGETPFACELCPLKFKYKHHLSNHLKSH